MEFLFYLFILLSKRLLIQFPLTNQALKIVIILNGYGSFPFFLSKGLSMHGGSFADTPIFILKGT